MPQSRQKQPTSKPSRFKSFLNLNSHGSNELQPTGLQVESLEPRMMLSTVSIYATGSTGQENLALQVEGQTVQVFENISTSGQTLTFETDQDLSSGQIRIAFTNDLYEPGVIDRNLTVEKIVVDGIEVSTQESDVFASGAWDPDAQAIVDGFGKGDTLNANGFFQFPERTAGGTTILVNARGSEGGELFRVIAGTETFGPRTVGTEQETFAFFAEGTVNASDIRIEFLNDEYVPENGFDRNLIVDNIEVNGQTFEAEDSSVFASGVFVPGEGIERGFLQSETLHANGYFQFASEETTPRFELDGSFSGDGFDDSVEGNPFGVELAESSTGQVAIYRSDLQFNGGVPVEIDDIIVYLPDGSRDQSFGINGAASIQNELLPVIQNSFEVDSITVSDVQFDSQGRVIVIGQVFKSNRPVAAQTFLLRLNADGSRDDSFASNGELQFLSFGGGAQIEVDQHDRIAVAGGVEAGILATRFNSDGSADNGYGNSGGFFFPGDQIPGFNSTVEDFELLGDGSVLILAGNPQVNVADAALIFKLNSAGELDGGFGNGGIVTIPRITTNPNLDLSDSFDLMEIDNQGRVVISGSQNIVRYTSSGQLDSSFADGGIFALPDSIVADGSASSFPAVESFAIDSSNRIVALINSQFALRLTADGNLDHSFSGDGVQNLDTPSTSIGSDGSLRTIRFDGNDNLLASGSAFPNLVVTRYSI